MQPCYVCTETDLTDLSLLVVCFGLVWHELPLLGVIETATATATAPPPDVDLIQYRRCDPTRQLRHDYSMRDPPREVVRLNAPFVAFPIASRPSPPRRAPPRLGTGLLRKTMITCTLNADLLPPPSRRHIIVAIANWELGARSSGIGARRSCARPSPCPRRGTVPHRGVVIGQARAGLSVHVHVHEPASRSGRNLPPHLLAHAHARARAGLSPLPSPSPLPGTSSCRKSTHGAARLGPTSSRRPEPHHPVCARTRNDGQLGVARHSHNPFSRPGPMALQVLHRRLLGEVPHPEGTVHRGGDNAHG